MVPDVYGTGFLYVLISKNIIPHRVIHKWKCTDELILFPYNEKLCKTLAEVLPELHARKFATRVAAWAREVKRKKRKKYLFTIQRKTLKHRFKVFLFK